MQTNARLLSFWRIYANINRQGGNAMLEQLKKKNTIIFTIVAIAIPLLITFGQFYIINYTPWFPDLDPMLPPGLLYFFAILEFLIGFVIGDVYVSKYRHSTKNWAGTLPDKQKKELWQKRAGLWAAAAIIFALGFILDMISLV